MGPDAIAEVNDLHTPTGVIISLAIAGESTRDGRPCTANCTSIANFAKSVGVVHSPAAACVFDLTPWRASPKTLQRCYAFQRPPPRPV